MGKQAPEQTMSHDRFSLPVQIQFRANHAQKVPSAQRGFRGGSGNESTSFNLGDGKHTTRFLSA
jgi:hypothetical protein